MTEPSPPPAPRAADDSPTADAAPSAEQDWPQTELGEPPVASPPPPPSGPPEEMATIGRIGRYALKYPIGEGGLGRVYAAHDPLLSRLIAIKTLPLHAAIEQRAALNELFLDEARAAAGLSHPHIVTVFDAGVEDEAAWIAMELLKGRDLQALRREGWRPSAKQSALLVRRVADALAYAHSKGVIHRDIKPANIFMVGRTQPKVLDFGIARVVHRREAPDAALTGGSPYYMAPEQSGAHPVDGRADVFSLGVVLYELLTGEKPFRGDNLEEIRRAVAEQEPPVVHVRCPDVPPALSAIVAKALRKDPRQRFSSARELARELRHWLHDHERHSQRSRGASPALRSPTLWFAGLAGLGLLGAAGWWWMAPPRHLPDSVVAAAAPEPGAERIEAASRAETVEPAPRVAAVDDRAGQALAAAQAALATAPATPAGPQPDSSGSAAPDPATAPAVHPPIAVAQAAAKSGPAPAPAPADLAPAPTPVDPAAEPVRPVESIPPGSSQALPRAPGKAPPAPARAPATPATAQAPAPSPSPSPSPSPPAPAARAVAPAPAPARAPRAAAPKPESSRHSAARASSAAHRTREAAPAVRPTTARRATPSKQQLAPAPASPPEAAPAPPPPPPARGVVRIAVSPWGSIEVNGNPMGTAPPLNQLTLPAGQHQITVRNADFPPYRATIEVTPDRPITLRHRFGT